MYKKLLAILFVFICAPVIMAQDDYHKVDVFAGFSLDIAQKFIGAPDRQNFKGFDTSAAYNFTKYLGAKVEFSSHRASQEYSLPFASFTSPTQGQIDFSGFNTNGKGSSYKLMAGLQIKDNSKEKKFKPFGHFLVGQVRQKLRYTDLNNNYQIILGTDNQTSNRFTWDVGGGIDVKVSRRIDIRLIQFDFNQFKTKAKTFVAVGDSRTFPAGTHSGINDKTLTATGAFTAVMPFTVPISNLSQRHFTFGFGIVFH